MGIDKNTVNELKFGNPDKSFSYLRGDADDNDVIKIAKSRQSQPSIIDPELDISSFVNVESMPQHPSALYAIKRGYVSDFKDRIKIDISTNSVVFLVFGKKNAVGYQKRFVRPINKNFKAATMTGFDKSQYLIEFPKKGADIVICEGPFTALSAWHYGYYGISTLGSAISQDQLKKIEEIHNVNGGNIGIALEPGEAGNKFFDIIKNYFFWKNINVFQILPINERNKDLNDAWQTRDSVKILNDFEFKNPAIPRIDLL
jgi:hypothetical protein